MSNYKKRKRAYILKIKFKNHRLEPVNIIIPMKKTTIVLGLLATLALASCAKKNNCPAYGRTSIDSPAAVKGRG